MEENSFDGSVCGNIDTGPSLLGAVFSMAAAMAQVPAQHRQGVAAVRALVTAMVAAVAAGDGAVQAGGSATWSGNSGSMGDVRVSGVIKAGVISSSKGALSEACLMAG